MRNRALLIVVAALVAAGAITAVVVTQTGGHGNAAQAAVSAQHGGSVSLGDATLTVPPGAVSGNGQLAATTTGSPPAGYGASALAGASAPVHFSVTGGAKVAGTLLITFRVPSAGVPAALPASAVPSAVWLAFYDSATGRWQAVASKYDPAAGTVTARVTHLSWWMPWTWDWAGMALRARQALSAFGSGRAPAVSCPGVPGVTVTSEGGQDPPMIGCAAKAGSGTLTVTVTNNRGLSMVLSAVPPDAKPGPRSYSGFYEYVADSATATAMLGGPDLPPGGTQTYTLPLHGGPATFTAAPTVSSYVLDLAAVAADTLIGKAKAGKVNGDYAKCAIDAVARTTPALANAADLAVSCLPLLADLVPGYADLAKTLGEKAVAVLQLAVVDTKLLLQTGDLAYDDLRVVQASVGVARPACTTASCQPQWTASGQLAPGPITSISCAGVFCAAVGATGTTGHSHGYALTYQSGSWSKPVQLGTGDSYAVSCPAATFCAAVTDTGYAYTLHAGTWSSPADIYPTANTQPSSADAIEDLSCATPGFCVAVTGTGNALMWNGTAWSPPQPIGLPGIEPAPFPGVFDHVSVSCPTPAYCLAGTGIDFTQAPSATWDGHGWTVTPQTSLKTTTWNVSCASATFCMAAGGYHAVGDQSAVWDGAAWSGIAQPPGEGAALAFSQVSCPQNGSCVAVDGGSFVNGSGSTRGSSVFTWSGGAWSGPQFTDTNGYLDAISCTPAGLCVAADSQGYLFVLAK
ncbi:MAG: hypothetical protein ABSB59_43145 [Streptosporangiaceae bacterium]|jgi:hypothetical protein